MATQSTFLLVEGFLNQFSSRLQPPAWVVDEVQNLTPHEVKTIVSRVGDGTKIVLTGDINQIDNPYLDASSNGLTHVIERMKGHAMCGHVTLAKTERSSLASLAAEIL